MKRHPEMAHLHSTMFLLIQNWPRFLKHPGKYLHSTMFLLIPAIHRIRSLRRSNLHSTMFLLIRIDSSVRAANNIYLHSTMFLLIPILHNPLYYKPNSTIFCQPCHLLYLSNTIFNNIMKIFLFLQ